MPIIHSFVSAKSDGADATLVRPSDWNAAHTGDVSWTSQFNLSGASFTGWTANSGTWASNGTIIQETQTPTAAYRRASYDTKQPLGYGVVAEFETRFPTTGQGTGANIQSAMLIGYNGITGTNGICVILDRGAGKVSLERQAAAAIITYTVTVNLDTWYKVRVVTAGLWATLYLDGTLVGTMSLAKEDSTTTEDYIGLFTYNAIADYRNIKLWVLSGGVPA